jgi:hypothetical protein
MELAIRPSNQILENLKTALRKLEETTDPHDPALVHCRGVIFRRIAYLEIDDAVENLPSFRRPSI